MFATAFLPTVDLFGPVSPGAYGYAPQRPLAVVASDVAPASLPVDVADQSDHPGATASGSPEPDIIKIVDALGAIVDPEHAVELRALGVPDPVTSAREVVSRIFAGDQLREMAEEAVRLSARREGVYLTLNPLDCRLLGQPRYARDTDIVRRRILLIDCDPKRDSHSSSTDAEKEAAWSVAQTVLTHLSGIGWPEPIVADSGNGWHLVYAIDLRSDDGGLIKRVLEALADRFDNDACEIDRKVHNPSRICKLYGTVARKGPNTAERPHRLSRIVGEIPFAFGVETITREMLEALAGEAPGSPTSRCRAKRARTAGQTPKAAQMANQGHVASEDGQPPKGRQSRRSEPTIGKRTGDVEKLAAELIRRFPVRRRGQRNGQMCSAIGYLVGRDYNDATIVLALKLWHAHHQAAGTTVTDEATHEAEVMRALPSIRSNAGFTAKGPRQHAAEAAAVTLPEALMQVLEPGSKAKKKKPRRGRRARNETLNNSPLQDLNSDAPEKAEEQELYRVTFPVTSLCRTAHEQAFAEALILLVHYKLRVLGEPTLRFTHDQLRGIAWQRHGLVWDNCQFDRLKAKYVDRLNVDGEGRTPASKRELLREIVKGDRHADEATGRPSEYEATGILDLLALWDVPREPSRSVA